MSLLTLRATMTAFSGLVARAEASETKLVTLDKIGFVKYRKILIFGTSTTLMTGNAAETTILTILVACCRS